MSVYKGELLPGFYDEWVVLEREHIRSVFEQKMGALLQRLAAESRWGEVLTWGEKWISFGQKPEPAYRALMSAHAALGDTSKVALVYERCLASLREFSLDPSEQTRDLYSSLKAGIQVPRPAKAHAAGVPGAPFPANIPVPLTSFVGRDSELKEIATLLSSARLLTLTGSGGVGRTRLAIEAAAASVGKFRDGVCWVGLENLADETLISQEIAEALGLRESSQEPLIETLKTYLRPRECLLVLDNCEHLIRGCARDAEQLLSACPKMRILATTVEALGLFGETVWRVPSLRSPDVKSTLSLSELRGFASVALFSERAGNAKSGFALNEDNAKAVAQICQRLDGIPLAIELAAARLKVISVGEIAARLDDRFLLLTAGSRTAIPRHQTLRATIDWSHELLTEAERYLFRRLSVFAGGFTLEAAEAICNQGMTPGEILDSLVRLVDKSLVIVEPASLAGQTRYRLLETIRQYALGKLANGGEASPIRERHAQFYLQLVEESEPNIFRRESAGWSRPPDKEMDNIRAAIEWCTASGKADLALRILGALVYFWFADELHASEWNDRIRQALTLPEAAERTLARAKALNGIGFMYWVDIPPADIRAELEEALSIGRELRDPWTIATALRNVGLLENIQGNYLSAQVHLEQSLELWQDMGPDGKMERAYALLFLGDVASNQANLVTAHSLYEESVAILRKAGDFFLPYPVRRLGQLAMRAGNLQDAFAFYKESFALNREMDDARGICACLAGFAAIAEARADYESAATLAAVVDARLASFGIRLLLADRIECEQTIARLRSQLDSDKLEELWIKGRAMTIEQAADLALGAPK